MNTKNKKEIKKEYKNYLKNDKKILNCRRLFAGLRSSS